METIKEENIRNEGNSQLPNDPEDIKDVIQESQAYKTGLAMLLFVRGYIGKYRHFHLEIKHKEQGIVFDEGHGHYKWLQLNTETAEDLKNLTDAAVLLKYLKTIESISFNRNSWSKNDNNSKDVIIITNTFKVDDKDLSQMNLEEIMLTDSIVFNLKSHKSSIRYFKLTDIDMLLERVKTQTKQFRGSVSSQQGVLTSLSDISDATLRMYLKKIIFVVTQFETSKVFDVIKHELEEHFKLYDATNMFVKLKDEITRWVLEKSSLNPIVTYRDAKDFFMKCSKTVSFGVTPPAKPFVGRERELPLIREKLQGQDDCLFSQTVVINGSSGVGKTELAKMFIEKYSHDYDGRVIWINAETKKSIENSFAKVAEQLQLELPDDRKTMYFDEDPKKIINLVLYYLTDVHVLYVFDNVCLNPEQKYTLDYLRDLVFEIDYRSHTIITSVDKFVKDNTFVLGLEALSLDEASEFIREHLHDATNDDVSQLATRMQCFPLTLQQSIAYIEAQQENIKDFSIEDYVLKMISKNYQLLDYEHPEDFNDVYARTIYVTVNLTIDTLKKTTYDAWKILKVVSYMRPNNIHPNIFLPLMDNDHLRLRITIATLRNYGIFHREQPNTFSIHEAVQKMIHLRFRNSRNHALEEGIKSVIFTVQKRDSINIKDEMEHVKCIWSHVINHKDMLLHYSDTPDVFDLKMIHYCAMFNNLKALKALLNLHPKYDIDCPDGFSDTALHIAVTEGYSKIVSLLIQKGSNVDLKNGRSQAPLHLAVQKHFIDIIEILIDSKANVNIRNDYDERTPLHLACQSGYSNIVRLLVEKGAEVNVKDHKNWTPLHLAAQLGYSDIVRCLLKNHANINAKTNKERSALHLATMSGRLDTIDVLLEAGANIDAKDGKGWTHLHTAVELATPEVIRILINKKADVNVKTPEGWSPLYLAVRKGHMDIVEFLIKNNADLHVKDFEGWMLLHVAARKGHLNIFKFLVEHGADVNSKTYEQHLPLYLAIQFGHFDIVDYLVKSGASIDSTNNDGWTSLHLMTAAGSLDIVKYLLQEGADLNARNNDGWTALHIATFWDQLNLIEFLLDKGMDVDTETAEGYTSLHIAVERGHLDAIQVLVQMGANINAKDRTEVTPLQYAILRKNYVVVEYLVNNGGDMSTKWKFIFCYRCMFCCYNSPEKK